MMQFYVYEHWRPDTRTCFYVGKGKGDRAYRFKWRKDYHSNVISKLRDQHLEPEVRFVAVDLCEADAFALERERIAFWRLQGVKLANLTDGGEGLNNPAPAIRAKMSAALLGNRRGLGKRSAEYCARLKIALSSPEVREKMSRARAGKQPALGRKASAEARAKMSSAHKGRKLSAKALEMVRRPKSDETKQKMRLANQGRVKSPETCAKISAAKKGRKATEAERAAMSKRRAGKIPEGCTMLGRTHSPETKAKMAASARARHAAKQAA